MRRCIQTIVLILATVTVTAYGDELYTLVSPNAQWIGLFGSSVSGVGDINNDGKADVIVGAHQENTGSGFDGRAYVFSGATGGVLHSLTSQNPEFTGSFGWSVSDAGDVNNDGRNDIIVGARNESGGVSDAGRAYVFSGNGGGWLYTMISGNPETDGSFGWSVSGAGDVNDDNFDDVIVGAPYEKTNVHTADGRAYVFSGNGGGPLFTLANPSPTAYGHFGWSVSGAGDVNNDGKDDVIVGAPGNSPGMSPDHAGRAYIYSGDTGGLLRTLMSPNEEYEGLFGSSVSDIGDMNNDGYGDVIVGAHYEDGGAQHAGRAYVFNGFDGACLYTLLSPNPDINGSFGYSVSAAEDINSDGYIDVVVGAPIEDGGASQAGRAYVFSCNGGVCLETFISPNPETDGYFGNSVSGAGNVNANAYADIIVGAQTEDGGADDAGRAYVLAGGPLRIELSSGLVSGNLYLTWTACPRQ